MSGTSPSAQCPVCLGRHITDIFSVYDDRYGFGEMFTLMGCGECGHKFIDGAKFSDADIQSLYSEYYPRKRQALDAYEAETAQSQFRSWLNGASAGAFRWVPPNVRVLDIGCGFGRALGYHIRRGCEAWGVESDENVRPIAEANGLNVRIGVFNPADFPQRYFDFVTMDQVIEHMRDPVGTLADVKEVLKPDGSVVISTPNPAGWGAKIFGRRWINWHAPYHLQFFTKHSMQVAARRAGLKSTHVGTVTSSEWLYYQWIHLATRPTQGRPSFFWSRTGSYSRHQRFAVRTATILHRTKLNHLLTRLFDSVGLGDSQLFVLRHA